VLWLAYVVACASTEGSSELLTIKEGIGWHAKGSHEVERKLELLE